MSIPIRRFVAFPAHFILGVDTIASDETVIRTDDRLGQRTGKKDRKKGQENMPWTSLKTTDYKQPEIGLISVTT
ncbi:hypothetical protein [Coleofasciculus sp. D1-CHI-01]|uniref:hypothetical protein n=1 Tax=Coleofasciculus sp. D1-CHI-01 TaxID=3068482 RepID=UPI004062E250